MKFALLVLSYMLQDAGYITARLDNGKCSACKRAGVRSKVFLGTCYTTAAACLEFYNEDGKIPPSAKCNTTTCSFRCSNNHAIQEVY